MKKTITLAGHQSISIPAKNRFVGYEVETRNEDLLTLDHLRPFMVSEDDLAKDWLTPEESTAWAYLKEEI